MMTKHTFTVLILLMGISVRVSGQKDTKNKKIDSIDRYHLNRTKKGLKWFIDPLHEKSKKYTTWMNGLSLGLGLGGANNNMQYESFSPVVHNVKALEYSAYLEQTSRHYWRVGYTTARSNVLRPTGPDFTNDAIDRSFKYVAHYPEIQWAMQIKKSSHYLGVDFYTVDYIIQRRNRFGSDNTVLSPEPDRYVAYGLLCLGALHVYHNELFKIPFRTRTSLSLFASGLTGDYHYGNFFHVFRVDFMLNKKQYQKWLVGYKWTMFRSYEEDTIFRNGISGGNSINITFVL